MDAIVTRINKKEDIEEINVQWKEEEEFTDKVKIFHQREAVLLDGKLRPFRENWYFKESMKARYIRLAVSLGFLYFFDVKNSS